MAVEGNKVGLPGGDLVDVINLKIDDLFYRDMIITRDGIMPAYHMNKMHWITVRLDGSVEPELVKGLIDMSFAATASRKQQEKFRSPKEWVIPSNPKYYDVINAFEEKDEIDWKLRAVIHNADCYRKVREEFGTFCAYIWAFSGGKTILYEGHGSGKVPVSNGLSEKISRDLKKRGFKYVGAITIYSHLQACGIINDHDEGCPCFHSINSGNPTVTKRRDHEVF